MSLEGKTEEEIKSLEGALLAEVENQGGAAGNVSLLRCLKWDDDLYWSVRDRLVEAGQLELGRGRGGSVRGVFTDATQITTRLRWKFNLFRSLKISYTNQSQRF